MQSGSALSFWALHTKTEVDYEAYVRLIAKHFNCEQNDFESLVECLRSVPSHQFDLLELQSLKVVRSQILIEMLNFFMIESLINPDNLS